MELASKVSFTALAGWLSWLEHRPVHLNVRGPSPVRAHISVGGWNPGQGMWEAMNRCFFLSSSLSKINKHVLRCGFKKSVLHIGELVTEESPARAIKMGKWWQ